MDRDASAAQASRDKKIDAVKKVIANMTVGKDVSMLFTDVLNCIQTGNIELKKLVYLYLINYATHPTWRLAVNTFVKDAADPNPLVRALAIRTMGCIRVERITEYLCEPLAASSGRRLRGARRRRSAWRSSTTSSPSWSSTGASSTPCGTSSRTRTRRSSRTPPPLTEISEASSDDDVMKMSTSVLQKLLAALNECTEWGQVSILDALANAVVMSAVKVILQYMYAAMDVESELCAGYRKKLAPLVTLVNGEPEMCYVALRNINLIVQRDRRILENEIKVFFCKYNDPIYVKLEKLEIMIRLVSEKNVDQVLLEFKEYAQEVDIDFVRRAVRAIGRCAVKLDKAAALRERALELIQTKVNYVVMEAVVVVKDIFRKYPNRYESVIGTLCENLESLDEPDAKASMIWIIGEYADQIENADELLETFLESFAEEEHAVQLQLLTATVKLFLKQPNEGKAQEMVQSTLDKATTTSDNPDLRDRGFIYWRLLSTNPDCAKAVVLGEKPAIQDDTDALDDDTLEDLLSRLATLASVYHKPPAAFVLDGDAAKDAAEGEEEEAYDFDDADGGGGGGDEPPAGDDDLRRHPRRRRRRRRGIAFKNADTGAVFYGAAPVDFDALWAPDGAMDRGAHRQLEGHRRLAETPSTVPDLPTGASIEAASAKLSARNAHYVARRAVPNQPAGTESNYKITLLPGDGIGPEITAATVKALNAAGATKGVSFEYDEQLLGGCAIDAAGTPWPEATLKSCQAADSILMAAIGGPKWDGNPRELRPETGLLAMRQELGLFANLRPAKAIPSSSRPGGKCCSIDKANVLDVSQLWKEVVIRVHGEQWADSVELSHMYVDNAAMQLVRWPKQFDTIVCGNIFGDILSDEASMLVGSLGMLPSASLPSEGPGVFEPIHGSARHRGTDAANPPR
ncbi:hypothetical protein JL722_1286 [Aureococcus anophagefferens]|nr:hypothetical protein JL722_1286 [Aureococcus anophagefferens]